MVEREPVDSMAPWTIKSVSVATREAVTKAAKMEGITTGQWLEKRVAEWLDQGSPVAVSNPAAPVNLGELAQAMEAARALASDAKVPVPPKLAQEGLNMIRRAIRQTKAAPASKRPPPLLEGPPIPSR